MPPFQYQQYVNPYVGTIGQLIARQGDTQAEALTATAQAQAQAAQTSGQIWGQAIGGIARSLGGIPGDITAARRAAVEEKRAASQAQLDQMKLQQERFNLQKGQREQEEIARAEQVYAAASATRPDGSVTVDPAQLDAALAQVNVSPDKRAKYVGYAETMRTTMDKFKEDRANHLGDVAQGAIEADAPLPVVLASARFAQQAGLLTKDQYDAFAQMATEAPDLKQLLTTVRNNAPKYMNEKPVFAPQGSPGFLRGPTFSSIEPRAKPKPETNAVYRDDQGIEHPVVFDESSGKYLYNGQDVSTQITRPSPPPTKDTGAELDANYERLHAKELRGEPLTELEKSQLKSYADRKTLGTRTTFNLNQPGREDAAAARKAQQEQIRADRSYTESKNDLEQLTKPVRDRSERFARFAETVKAGGPVADAVLAPELLSITSGGMGSGLRMSEAEIGRILGSTSAWGDLLKAASRFNPNESQTMQLTPTQRASMNKLVSAIAEKSQQQFAILQQARQDLLDAGDDVAAHRRIMADTKTRIEEVLNPSAQRQSGAPRLPAARAALVNPFPEK